MEDQFAKLQKSIMGGREDKNQGVRESKQEEEEEMLM